MSRIFFTVNTDTGRTHVIASIYADGGHLLAEHRMTIDGARIRMRDMEAAITEAQEIHGIEPRYPDYPSIRVDSLHEEDVIGGRAYCPICGMVDELDLIKNRAAIVEWHGDSFGLF